MPSAHHERIVATLVRNGCSSRGFVTDMQALARDRFGDSDLSEIPELVRSVNPDAWRIDAEHRAVYMYEVDTSSFLTDFKWVSYLAVGWWLDCESWTGFLVRVDAYGNANEFPLDWALQSYVKNVAATTSPLRNPSFWCERWSSQVLVAA